MKRKTCRDHTRACSAGGIPRGKKETGQGHEGKTSSSQTLQVQNGFLLPCRPGQVTQVLSKEPESLVQELERKPVVDVCIPREGTLTTSGQREAVIYITIWSPGCCQPQVLPGSLGDFPRLQQTQGSTLPLAKQL